MESSEEGKLLELLLDNLLKSEELFTSYTSSVFESLFPFFKKNPVNVFPFKLQLSTNCIAEGEEKVIKFGKIRLFGDTLKLSEVSFSVQLETTE